MIKKMYILFFVITLFITVMLRSHVFAIDSEFTRQTLAGLKGVNVVVEDLQPNIQKYAQKFDLNRETLKKEIEQGLQRSGITVLTQENWLKTPGKSFLYIDINTHEYEKYWYAYDIKIELRQIVYLEADPKNKTLASTWSTSMTGVANIGTLNAIKNNVLNLLDRFIAAYFSVNPKKQ